MSTATDEGSADGPPAEEESSLFDEQNFAGYLLIVGSVTAVFVAAFTFLLSGAVSQVLIAITITLGFLSVLIGFALNVLGHFEDRPTTGTTEKSTTTTRRAWKPDTPVNKPLPPLINFDTELRRLEEHFGGELPDQMDSFVEDYRQLRTTNGIDKRRSIASSMRSALNPLPVLVDDEEMEDVVDEMGDRLFRYIQADATEHLTVSDAAFYRDGESRPLAEIQGSEARIKATVHNAGEASTAEVEVEFNNRDGIKVKSTSLPVGQLPPNARKDLNTHVYVPSLAADATIYAVASAQGDEVLEM